MAARRVRRNRLSQIDKLFQWGIVVDARVTPFHAAMGFVEWGPTQEPRAENAGSHNRRSRRNSRSAKPSGAAWQFVPGPLNFRPRAASTEG